MTRLFLIFVTLMVALPVQAFDLKSLVGGLPTECQYKRASDGIEISTDDPDYPLEFVEDCYKFSRFYEETAINRKSGETLYKKEKAEWLWKYKVKNKSNNLLKVSVIYKLKDKDDFVLAETYSNNNAPSNDDVVLSGKIVMDKDLAKKVAYSGWEITYAELKK